MGLVCEHWNGGQSAQVYSPYKSVIELYIIMCVCVCVCVCACVCVNERELVSEREREREREHMKLNLTFPTLQWGRVHGLVDWTSGRKLDSQ